MKGIICLKPKCTRYRYYEIHFCVSNKLAIEYLSHTI